MNGHLRSIFRGPLRVVPIITRFFFYLKAHIESCTYTYSFCSLSLFPCTQDDIALTFLILFFSLSFTHSLYVGMYVCIHSEVAGASHAQ